MDASGRVVKQWNLAQIIRAAMIAGGDDPNQFVYSTPTDWCHLNGVTYNRADDSLTFSSRENFLICIDYETNGIRWILGDPTKKWYQFPSLRNFALALPPGSLPPIGQHAPSIAFDQNLLLFDNGQYSVFNVPRGEQRRYAAPRKYNLDLNARTATEVWNFESGQSIPCPYCASVYEDAPLNYSSTMHLKALADKTRSRGFWLECRWGDDFLLPVPDLQLFESLSRVAHSFGKYEVPNGGPSSAQPLNSGTCVGWRQRSDRWLCCFRDRSQDSSASRAGAIA